MTNIINISDFRNNISDYINRVIYNKDYFLLKRGKKIVAKVVNYQKSKESKEENKIARFAGIWDSKEGKMIGYYAKKLRKKAKIIP